MVAEAEGIDPQKLAHLLAQGRVVLPYNAIHAPKPIGIGEGLRVKVNANIGTSPDYANPDEEVEKAKTALKYGADTIMDLSIGGDIDHIRRKLLETVDVPLGTVPIYQAAIDAIRRGKAIVDMSKDDMFNIVEKQAKDGVDFMTVHCGVTREGVERLKRQGRIMDVVSRGGAFLTAWMVHHGEENPLYSNYDQLLDIAERYDVTLSLGDGLRPGCIADASDRAQIQELVVLGELVKRARERGVQAMVEGPGHIPLDQIKSNVEIEKMVCNNAPFYVLGPIVTDIAPGYDHIVGAIGGALAALHGADFLCYVTPSEHLALPTIEDVKRGVVASKIAAHAADIVRDRRWADADVGMASARGSADWEGQFEHALYPEIAQEYRKRRKPMDPKTCSMCGDLCALKIIKEYLK
jgi:phosphomethylpyrimidine synthase